MAYNSDIKGYETKDCGHTRDTINYDTNTGKGSIDQHNADKSSKSSTDIRCFLTTACMKYFKEEFDDNCYELTVLRWFRDNFVSKQDIEKYYEIAPIIVENINKEEKKDVIYDYIYDNIVDYCIEQIEQGNYTQAYARYKNSLLTLEEQFARPFLEQRLVKSLKLGR